MPQKPHLPLPHNPQAHDAAITKVSWAHPEFGTILASSSFDRTVKVWEQTSYSDPDSQTNGTSGSRWVERASLIDAKGTVRAVEFAPHHFGLKLVSYCSSRGTVASTLSTLHLYPLEPFERDTNRVYRLFCRLRYPPTTICAYTNA